MCLADCHRSAIKRLVVGISVIRERTMRGCCSALGCLSRRPICVMGWRSCWGAESFARVIDGARFCLRCVFGGRVVIGVALSVIEVAYAAVSLGYLRRGFPPYGLES